LETNLLFLFVSPQEEGRGGGGAEGRKGGGERRGTKKGKRGAGFFWYFSAFEPIAPTGVDVERFQKSCIPPPPSLNVRLRGGYWSKSGEECEMIE